jgi:hypothetical protein
MIRSSVTLLLFLVTIQHSWAQAPVAQPKKKVYATGRVEPKDLAQLRARSVRNYAGMLKNLPKATAVTWDCRTLGQVPPIVDQGQCGSCWDFSGTSICNSALIIAGYGKADGTFTLSEQYTLDCGSNGGCDGDDNTTVTAWALKTGLPSTQQYGPYQGAAGSCKLTPAMTLYKISATGFCTTTDTQGVANTQDIKNAMAKFGPIGSGIAADDAFMNNPPGTVFKGSGSTSINHDIVLVGWDDSKGAWILRNSWGTSWCDGGYCYISYGANGVGTEAIWATAQPLPQIPTITSPLTISAVIAAPLSYQIVASNSPTSFGATGLPAGLTCDSTAGLISGSPTTSGTYQVTLSAANAIGTGSATLTMSIAAGPGPGPAGAPVITSPLSTSVVVNTPLSYQITATNSPLLLGASGLPPGLSCSITGLIVGTPTSTGSFPIVLLAGNASGMGTSTLTLVVTTVMNPVTLTLTPDQVQAVIAASGVVTIRADMTMRELHDALSKCVSPSTSPGPGPSTHKLEDEVRDLKRAVDAMMKLLLPPDKAQEPPLLMPPAIDSKLMLRVTNVYAMENNNEDSSICNRGLNHVRLC